VADALAARDRAAAGPTGWALSGGGGLWVTAETRLGWRPVKATRRRVVSQF
jgi:hypothetical protein